MLPDIRKNVALALCSPNTRRISAVDAGSGPSSIVSATCFSLVSTVYRQRGDRSAIDGTSQRGAVHSNPETIVTARAAPTNQRIHLQTMRLRGGSSRAESH